MALGDKPPLEYDSGKIQALLEKLDRKIKGLETTTRKDLQDLSKELTNSIDKVSSELSDKIDSRTGEESSFPTIIPVPENLKVNEFGFWGFAHVDPFMKWKYIGKLVGYEFYGSPNENFTPQADPYTQNGTHWGDGPNDIYLNTEHPTDDSLSFVLDNRLVKLLPQNQLIIQNVNRSATGKTTDTTAYRLIDSNNDFANIEIGMKAYNPAKHSTISETYTTGAWANVTNVSPGELVLDADIFTRTGDDYMVGVGRIEPLAYGIKPKYMVKADGVTWNNGDSWRIYKYPQNKLFSIGAFCTFTKRLGNFYVKARSVGKGHSFSDFTEAVLSEGISSTAELETVRIVFPIHALGDIDGPDGVECEMIGGIPSCPNHGLIVDDAGNVDWSQISAGTREIAHYDVFGYERSVIELVYETLDTDDPTVYKVLVTNDDDDTEEGDVS